MMYLMKVLGEMKQVIGIIKINFVKFSNIHEQYESILKCEENVAWLLRWLFLKITIFLNK